MATTHSSGKKSPTKKWSADVTENSDALDLEKNIFESNDPKKIAESLKKSAEKSNRRKTTPFQSAMSMLSFYINRAGKNLPETQRIHWRKQKMNYEKHLGVNELMYKCPLSPQSKLIRNSTV